MEIRASWSSLRDLVDAHGLSFSYSDSWGNYYLFVVYAGVTYVCVLDKLSEDAGVFSDSYKDASIQLPSVN